MVTLLICVIGLALGLAAFNTHRADWIGHNGDHYYYASTALQYAGVRYDDSLRMAADYFHYPLDPNQLDLGYLNPSVAPLIYPRVVLGLLALPAVHQYGIAGVWFPGLLCGTLALLLMMRLGLRRLGRPALLLIPVLIGITRYAPEFMFGIYLEAPVLVATVAMMLTLPLGAVRRGWWYAVAAAGLVPVMMLSRQVPLLPVGMVLGGWLWAWIGARRLRNAWWPFVLTVLPVTAVSYLLLARWAPYDVLPYLYAKTNSANTEQLWQALPQMWRQTVWVDAADVLAHDRWILALTALALIGLLLAFRNPVAGLCLGSVVSGAVTELLNGQPNAFRYLSPSLPPLVLLATLLLLWLPRAGAMPVAALLLRLDRFRRAGPVERGLRSLRRGASDGWPGRFLIRPEPRRRPSAATSPPSALPASTVLPARSTRPAPTGLVWATGSWLLVTALLAGSMLTHRAVPIESAGARSRNVEAAGYGVDWPFTVSRGTLICAGDDFELWFIGPGGTRYALSGTAMARTVDLPSVLSLAPVDRIEYGWPQLKKLLTDGMKLCEPARGFQAGKV